MSNGIARVPVLPRKVAAVVTVFAATRGAWAIAATTLVVCVPGITELFIRQGYPGDLPLPLAVLVVMLALIGVMIVKPSPWSLAAYVVLGGVCVYLFLHSVLDGHSGLLPGALLLINRPATALVLVGTAGSRPRNAVFWGLGGFVSGEAATAIVSMQDGIPIDFGYGPIITLAFYLAVFVDLSFIQRAQRARVPDFLRMRRETRQLEASRTIEQRGVALLHDTVLNDLALVINGPDVITASIRQRLLDDVATLAAPDLLGSAQRQAFADPSDAMLRNRLILLVTDFQWRGLSVDVTGDSGRVVHMSPLALDAAVGALRACLENVLRHSGRNSAEIIVSATDTFITWTVSDDGVGFDPSTVSEDRLGLRTSVRHRVESAGGKVKIFSAPGSGTSVLVTLPMLAVAETVDVGAAQPPAMPQGGRSATVSAWSRSPQEVDPLSWFAGPVLPLIFAGAAVIQGLATTLIYWHHWSSVPLQFVAIVLFFGAGVLLSRFTMPNQPKLSVVRAASVLAIAVAALVLASIGTAHGSVPLQQWWPGIALGATLASLAPYSSARRMIGYSAAALLLVGIDGRILFSSIPSIFPPLGTVVIAAGPVAVAAVAVIVFCYTVVARSLAYLETGAGDEEFYSATGAVDDAQAQERVARVSARVAPFIERVAESGRITSADRALAAQIARSLRSELVGVADRSWLDALAEHTPIVISDPARLADEMNESQRAALRGLLLAARDSSVVDPQTLLIELRAQDDESTAVALSIDVDLPEGRRLRLLAPYYLTLKTTVDGISWADGPVTRLNFRIPPSG